MDALERTFGKPEAEIISGTDRKYWPGDPVKVCTKSLGQRGVHIEVAEGRIDEYKGREKRWPGGFRDIGHRYTVRVKGELAEYNENSLYSIDTPIDDIQGNPFRI